MKKIPSTMQLSNLSLSSFTLKYASIFIAARAIFYSASVVFGSNFSAMAQIPPVAGAGAGPTAGANRSAQGVTLNFVNAEIADVARTMGVMTNRNIVVDPRVKGTMNLSSEKPLSTAAAYNQFLAMLRFQGFTVVEVGGISKIVPEADAKLQGGSVTTSEARVGGNQISTQIFRLNYETANNLVPILRPLISPNNTINVNPGNNSLIITDYADNLQRLSRIIATLDVANATDLEIITLQHAVAADLAPLLLRLSEGGSAPGAAAGQADTAFKTAILPEPRSNAIIIRAANPARLQIIKTLVQKLDQPSSALNSGNIHVVYLKNADATRVAATLRAALAANTSGAAAAGGGGTVAAAPQAAAGAAGASAATAPTSQNALPSTGGNIQADPATNSLIITASEPQMRQMRAVIDMLDQRRAQVFIEALIAEVSDTKAAEFGIQWQTNLGSVAGTTVGVLGTNYGSGADNIVSLAGAIASRTTPASNPLGNGINFGLLRNVNGTAVLGLLARFLQSSNDSNVLSTPNLLTLDNEEAKIVDGQNVPFITGQSTGTNTGSSTSNPFQTIERKDVGLTLRIKPQISESGTIKMQVFQEISDVISNSTLGPTTTKRSVESTVLVEDGGIVVLGGLLKDKYSNGVSKIPGLGDIPVIGNLFKTETRDRVKTSLMVFLRPVVVRDAASTDNLSLSRYDIMRTIQKDVQPLPSNLVPINESAVLPPQAPAVRNPSIKPAIAPLGQIEKGGP
jgi:general secretion pathway protein D